MDITLTKQQSKFVTSTADTIHWIGNCAEGKSFAAKVKMYKFLKDNPQTCGLIYYPTYRNLMDQLFDTKDSFGFLFPALIWNTVNCEIEFSNGSRIIAVTFADFDRARCISAQIIMVDNFGANHYKTFAHDVRLPRPKAGVKTQTIICTTDMNEINPRIVETSNAITVNPHIKPLRPIDELGNAICATGQTWTNEMRNAWDKAKDEDEKHVKLLSRNY